MITISDFWRRSNLRKSAAFGSTVSGFRYSQIMRLAATRICDPISSRRLSLTVSRLLFKFLGYPEQFTLDLRS